MAGLDVARIKKDFPLLQQQIDGKRIVYLDSAASSEKPQAVLDAMDEAYEVIDMSNREVRFALILMGGLNAFVVIAATRGELISSLKGFQRLLAGGFLAVYGGDTAAEAKKALAEVKASGRFPAANVRKMQVYVTYQLE